MKHVQEEILYIVNFVTCHVVAVRVSSEDLSLKVTRAPAVAQVLCWVCTEVKPPTGGAPFSD